MMGGFAEAVGRPGFSAAPNAKYGPRDVARYIVLAATGGKNVASVSEARRHAALAAKQRADVPSGEWLRTAGVSAEAVELLDLFVEELAAELRKRGLLKGRIDMAIDFHCIKRYDKKPKELIRGGDKKSMTKAFYETYATIQCVVAGQRLIVGMIPYMPNQTHAEAVSKLLEICAGHGLRIGVLTLDRGFSTAVISCLQKADLKWIMPCPNTPHGQGRVRVRHDHRAAQGQAQEKRGRIVRDPWEKYIAFATSDPELDVAEYAKR